MLVGGEAGIGKSRLADELARHVEQTGGRVLRGSASFPETTPYQCFVEALRSALPLVAATGLAPVWLAALAGLVPEIHERLPDVPAQPRLDPERERQRLIEAIVRTMLAFSKPRPLLLILEDLHWADEAAVSALLALDPRPARIGPDRRDASRRRNTGNASASPPPPRVAEPRAVAAAHAAAPGR